ncbi:unnamed protein product, partial [Ascophyllum nodosum]
GLHHYAGFLANQGKYDDAEPLYKRALTIREEVLGPRHPDVASILNNLASLLESQVIFVKQSIQRVAQWGNVTTWFDQLARRNCGLHHYAAFLANQGKYDDAEPLYKRALTIKEEVLGPRHPDVASRLNNLASLLKSQGKYDDAEPLYKRALTIREEVLGPRHPDVASSLNNLATLLASQVMWY